MPHDRHLVELVRCGPPECHLLSDWCDGVLGRDYFFKRRHLQSILERGTNSVFAVAIDGHMGGLVIVYRGAVLDNLYIAPEYRESGVGSAILQYIRPARIRSKTNMLAGDPTGFYERNGYVKDQPDPERPHIIDMVRSSSSPSNLGGVTPSPAGSAVAEPFCFTPPANGRAVGVAGHLGGFGAAQPAVATPTPAASPAMAAGDVNLLPSGHVVLTVEKYNELEKLRRNRERITKYRTKRRAEQKAIDAAAEVAGGDIFVGEQELNGVGH